MGPGLSRPGPVWPRRLAGAAALAAAIALAALAVRTEQELPANPHAFMDRPDQCPTCHAAYRGELSTHEFIEPMPPRCMACHTEGELGRSHPIGVDPRRSRLEILPPEELPLEDGLVSCGTCHNPHAPHLGLVRAAPDQDPVVTLERAGVEIPYYRTFYLRRSDPEEGFTPLCHACHPDF